MTEMTATERATHDRITAAPPAEESAEERVARAIWEASNPAVGMVLTPEQVDSTWDAAMLSPLREEYRRIARAAIAAMQGGAL